MVAAVIAGSALALASCGGSPGLSEGQNLASDTVLQDDPNGLQDILDDPELVASVNSFLRFTPGLLFSKAQMAEIGDAAVTEEEYHASFARVQACVSEEGYQLENVRMDGALYDYGIPDSVMSSGAYDKCFNREHVAVWTIWERSHQDEIDRKMRLGQCVSEAEVDMTTDSGDPPTAAEFEQMLTEAGIDPENC